MECNINIINLKTKEEITLVSNINSSGILCTKFEESPPNGEFSYTKGVNQYGQSINSCTLSPRDISCEGLIIGENRKQVELFKKQISYVLNPLYDLLIKYTDDNVKKEIKVRAASLPKFSIELNTNNLLAFKVDFDANYPLWQDQNETVLNIETWESTFEFEFELANEGIDFARKGPNEIEVINDGQEEAPLEFYFIGPALNPKIILNNDEYVQVNKKVEDGEILYICTAYGNRKVEIIKNNGDRVKAYNHIDELSTFFKLATGINIISYSTEGDFIPQSVVVKYKNQYLSL